MRTFFCLFIRLKDKLATPRIWEFRAPHFFSSTMVHFVPTKFYIRGLPNKERDQSFRGVQDYPEFSVCLSPLQRNLRDLRDGRNVECWDVHSVVAWTCLHI